MTPLNPASKPYSNDANTQSALPGETAIWPWWPDSPNPFARNPKSRKSSILPPVPTTFLPAVSPPQNLPLRPPPQTPAFAALDAAYNLTSHPILGNQGAGREGYKEEEDESRSKAALNILEQHIKDRTPYTQLASGRLQAVCGVRNESVFDLPELPRTTLSPGLRGLYDMPDGICGNAGVGMGGIRARAAAKPGGGGAGSRDIGAGCAQKNPLGMHAVDKVTGKGLREFFLQKGKEFGMRKRECKSISFHDFTPDMRDGSHRNVLLGHYGVEKGERIDVYEVDLLTMEVDENTGEETPNPEPWIWILISRPVVSFDSTDTSTQIPQGSPNLDSPCSTLFFTPYSIQHSVEPTFQSSPRPRPPPNFPHPIPTSWLVFAAPLAHVTSYPEVIESLETAPEQQVSPFSIPTPPCKKVNKRRDYDFSFSGIPLFEFSAPDLFTCVTRMDFLSVEDIGGWCEGDASQEFPKEEYKRMYSLWEDGEWIVGAEGAACGSRGPVPAPNRGLWWKVFFQRMNEDSVRWQKIKKAMGRGKCRVVVRWVEMEGAEEETRLGLRGGVSGSRGTAGVKNKAAIGKRLTRSETRRRPALGIGDPSVGAVAGGVALGESAKSRAVGNKELGRTGGVTGEKEKRR